LSILVAHSDPLVRVGLMAALRQYAGFDVHVDGADAPSRDESRIDVVIADYRHALQLADTVVRGTCGPHAPARILVLAASDREVEIRRAVEAGVHGYLLLGSPLEELIDGVTTVAVGLRYIGRTAAQRMADSLACAALTARETDVLRVLAAGGSNKVIARQLRIELATVKTHIRAIFAKLGAMSRSHAVCIAMTRGLVDEHADERRGAGRPVLHH
jgi:DNA-binding NarL/FixJ family response regulator